MEAITPKLAELIPAAVAFLVLFSILSRFAFPPITGMLEERSKTIRESLERAEETRVEAERLLADYQKQMAEARAEANRIFAESRQVAEQMKAEIVAKAQEEATNMAEKARQTIEAEKKAAMAQLQASVADLSVAVASKIIGTQLSKEQHLDLIEKAVSEAGGLNAN